MQCDSFTRFEIDIDIIALAELLHCCAEEINIVAGTSDVVTATEVEPFKSRDEVPEVSFKRIGGVLQGVSILLAKCVEVETVQLFERVIWQCFECLLKRFSSGA